MFQPPLIAKNITHRDGTKEPFNADKINKSIERAARGLTDPISKVIQIATETKLTIYDGITTTEMDEATINAAVQNIKEDPEYDRIATRLLVKTIYKSAIGDYDEDNPTDLRERHIRYFPEYIKTAVEEGRLDTRMVTGASTSMPWLWPWIWSVTNSLSTQDSTPSRISTFSVTRSRRSIGRLRRSTG